MVERPPNVEDMDEDFLARYLARDQLRAFRDEVFPSLYELDTSPEKEILYDLYMNDLDTISSTNLYRNDEVLAWVNSSRSQLLWVDGFAETAKLNWTTKFCMLLEDAALPYDTVTTLNYYCNSYAASPKVNRPETVLQSLIVQIISAHPREFSWRSCREKHMTCLRFSAARNDIPRLWDLFDDCLKIADRPCTYVLIDSIDSLWPRQCDNSEELEIFGNLLTGLRRLAINKSSLCKVLITSRMASPLEYFLAQNLALSDRGHEQIVRIPRTAQGGIERFGTPKRVHRIPISRTTPPAKITDLNAFLENSDGEEEQTSSEGEGKGGSVRSPDYIDSDEDSGDNRVLGRHGTDYADFLKSPDASESSVGDASEEVISDLSAADSDEDDAFGDLDPSLKMSNSISSPLLKPAGADDQISISDLQSEPDSDASIPSQREAVAAGGKKALSTQATAPLNDPDEGGPHMDSNA